MWFIIRLSLKILLLSLVVIILQSLQNLSKDLAVWDINGNDVLRFWSCFKFSPGRSSTRVEEANCNLYENCIIRDLVVDSPCTSLSLSFLISLVAMLVLACPFPELLWGWNSMEFTECLLTTNRYKNRDREKSTTKLPLTWSKALVDGSRKTCTKTNDSMYVKEFWKL